MKDYSVSVDDKQYTIGVKAVDDKTFTVSQGGQEYLVKVDQKVTYGKPLVVNVDGHSFKVELGRVNRETLAVSVEKRNRSVRVHPIFARKELAPKPTSEAAPRDPSATTRIEGAIEAPMPGRIIALKVAVGDKVKQGDAVLILEAMKMENEIITPREGTVREVKVSQGMSVGKGDVLAIVR